MCDGNWKSQTEMDGERENRHTELRGLWAVEFGPSASIRPTRGPLESHEKLQQPLISCQTAASAPTLVMNSLEARYFCFCEMQAVDV